MRTFGEVERALVLAAHADDESLGAGGTIRRLVEEGVTVAVAVATDSTTAQYPNDSAARQRRWEAFSKAMDLLGAKALESLRAPDMTLNDLPGVQLASWVSDLVETVRPEVVLSTSPFDVNSDHRALAAAVGVACRPLHQSPVRMLAWYETPSSTEWGTSQGLPPFQPNIAVCIDHQLEAKLAAIATYADELRSIPHPRALQAVADLARLRGATFGFLAAEVFQIVHMRWYSPLQ